MRNRSVILFEPFWLLGYSLISGIYFVFSDPKKSIVLFNKFENDYAIFGGLFILVGLLCFIKYSANNQGISRNIFLFPYKQTTKSWREIKHMAHVCYSKKDGNGKIRCHNKIYFIDYNDIVCLIIADKTKKSTYDRKSKKIITKDVLTKSGKYTDFLKLIKRREDTFETDILLKKPIFIGSKMEYTNVITNK
jgi:hypothetical protein